MENKGDSGVVATIKGGKDGKTIAFRADFDALKIKETNEVDYISEHEGLMHACGHDAHATMLLGAAKVLNENKENLAGTVKLIFQADEENSTGALCAIKEGCLEGVDAIFGTHIGSIISRDIPAGKVIITPGRVMASNDKFVIRVKGYGCHGSTPEKGVDPINIGAHIVVNLQEVITREIAAVRPCVMTVGMFRPAILTILSRLRHILRVLCVLLKKKFVRNWQNVSVRLQKQLPRPSVPTRNVRSFGAFRRW